jgi:hypothetical protein
VTCWELESALSCPLSSTKTMGVSHCRLAISIKRQKKNYGNSNISPCKNIIFKKSYEGNKNPSRYYNSVINLKSQHKPRYHLAKIFM